MRRKRLAIIAVLTGALLSGGVAVAGAASADDEKLEHTCTTDWSNWDGKWITTCVTNMPVGMPGERCTKRWSWAKRTWATRCTYRY